MKYIVLGFGLCILNSFASENKIRIINNGPVTFTAYYKNVYGCKAHQYISPQENICLSTLTSLPDPQSIVLSWNDFQNQEKLVINVNDPNSTIMINPAIAIQKGKLPIIYRMLKSTTQKPLPNQALPFASREYKRFKSSSCSSSSTHSSEYSPD